MQWTKMTNADQIQQIREESKTHPVLIYKHSFRCNISASTLARLERHWNEAEVGDGKLYFLDLITYREISNRIAEEFDVEHESPQVLIIRHEKPAFHQSHFEINYPDVRDALRDFE